MQALLTSSARVYRSANKFISITPKSKCPTIDSHVRRRYTPLTVVPAKHEHLVTIPFTIEVPRTHLRKMKLQRIIRTQTNIQPDLKEPFKRVPLIRQEKRIVAQRAHRNTYLAEVEQIL